MRENHRHSLQHLLADLYHTRIVDITDDDVNNFMRDLRRHELMLVTREAVIK